MTAADIPDIRALLEKRLKESLARDMPDAAAGEIAQAAKELMTLATSAAERLREARP